MTPLPQFVVLIVEDEASQVSLFNDNVQDFNAKHSVCTFRVEEATSIDQARDQLKSKRIDCAVIDLRLPDTSDLAHAPNPERGNRLLGEIVDCSAIPLAVVTGLPDEFERPKSSKIEVFTREGDAYPKALAWLAQLAPLMRLLKDAQNNIAQETAKLFHCSIWPRWQSDVDIEPNFEKAKTAITRQVVCHLFEYLNIAKGAAAYFFPHEFYLKPPLRSRLHTGDLLCLENKIWIIMTPQCNMANGTYPDAILVACCDEISEWQHIMEKRSDPSRTKQNDAAKQINKLVTQPEISSHFLPPCDNQGPWKVNFKCIKTVPSNSVEDLLKNRVASLSPQFIPHLIQRFASYMGRIGQPELDQEELSKFIQTQPAPTRSPVA